MTSRPHPAPGPRAGGGRPWPPPGGQKKAGQQPRPTVGVGSSLYGYRYSHRHPQLRGYLALRS